jgi:hypothetical protein
MPDATSDLDGVGDLDGLVRPARDFSAGLFEVPDGRTRVRFRELRRTV